MRLLLDTHTLLWWLADDNNLPEAARNAIADSTNAVFVSSASGWELSIKRSLGKLEAPDGLFNVLAEEGFEELPIGFNDGLRAGALPMIHRDPFDRMLVAQSQANSLTLVTKDPLIAQYGVATLWS